MTRYPRLGTKVDQSLSGRTVVVTGAGSNLGRVLARRFHAAGAQVALCDIDPETAASTVTELTPLGTARVWGRACDIADERAVRRFFAGVKRIFGTIDILVNNAAHLGIDQPPDLLDQSTAGFACILGVNVVGTFMCTREAVRLMAGTGAIVNIGSITSERSIRGRPAYIASKGAITGLTRALALDLAPRIRVNEIAPGYILTPRWQALTARARRLRRRSVPLGEPATAEAVAETALFIAGDGARAITGARLVVDGGCNVQLVPTDLQV
jgi:NAD(P)-dependent dehydrogenase (short-subunit alcohol dehydrogenase family)